MQHPSSCIERATIGELPLFFSVSPFLFPAPQYGFSSLPTLFPAPQQGFSSFQALFSTPESTMIISSQSYNDSSLQNHDFLNVNLLVLGHTSFAHWLLLALIHLQENILQYNDSSRLNRKSSPQSPLPHDTQSSVSSTADSHSLLTKYEYIREVYKVANCEWEEGGGRPTPRVKMSRNKMACQLRENEREEWKAILKALIRVAQEFFTNSVTLFYFL